MPLIKSEAIVLKSFKFGESSKIVTLMTDNSGKFSAMIKGVRSAKSKSAGAYENMNNVIIFFNKKENRDLQYISKTECISTFSSLKKNLDKLTSAYKIIELFNKSMYDYDNNPFAFNLLKECLSVINDFSFDMNMVYILFQLKLSDILGINISKIKRNYDEEINVSDTINGLSKITFDDNEQNFLNEMSYKSFKELGNMNFNYEMSEEISNKLDRHFLEHNGQSSYLRSTIIKENLNKRFL